MAEPLVKRTWSPVGKTPILKRRARSHDKVTVIGAVACRHDGSQARFLFRLLPGKNANGGTFVEFLRQLASDLRGPIIVVWDRLNAHRSVKVAAHVASTSGRIDLEYFPPYAPELNPVEYSWAYLKGHALVNFAATDLESLRQKTKREICRMRSQRSIVTSWLTQSRLPW